MKAPRNFLIKLVLFSALTLGSPLCYADPIVSGPSTGAGTQENDFAPKLQTYFSERKKDLGELEPWQSKLFDEEAVPEFQRFVRDYHSAKGKNAPVGSAMPAPEEISAEIDFESLKNFLKFYGPKYSKRDKVGADAAALPTLLVVMRPQLNCAKCVSVLPALKTMVIARLDRRGLKPIWATASEITSSRSMGNDYQSAANHLAGQKKAMGVLLLSWQVAEADDLESAHADEVKYKIHSFLNMGDLISTEASLEVAENGSFERAGGKLLADAFTELGASIKKTELAQSEQGRTEVVLEVFGWHGFEEYRKLRTQIQDNLKSMARVDEFRISRGKAVFAVHSDSTPEAIQKQLATLKVDGLRLTPVTLSDSRIHMEIAPEITGEKK